MGAGEWIWLMSRRMSKARAVGTFLGGTDRQVRDANSIFPPARIILVIVRMRLAGRRQLNRGRVVLRQAQAAMWIPVEQVEAFVRDHAAREADCLKRLDK